MSFCSLEAMRVSAENALYCAKIAHLLSGYMPRDTIALALSYMDECYCWDRTRYSRFTADYDAQYAFGASMHTDVFALSFYHFVTLYNVMRARPMRTLIHSHAAKISALMILPEDRLAAGYADGGIALWDLQKPALITFFKLYACHISALALFPNNFLVAGHAEGSMYVWHMERPGKPVASLTGHVGCISQLHALSNRMLVSASSDGHMLIHDMHTYRPLASVTAHQGWISTITAAPEDGLITGSLDGATKLWRIEPSGEGSPLAYRLISTNMLLGHGSNRWIVGIASMPDGGHVSTDDSGVLLLWNLYQRRVSERMHVPVRKAVRLYSTPQGKIMLLDRCQRECILSVLEPVYDHQSIEDALVWTALPFKRRS